MRNTWRPLPIRRGPLRHPPTRVSSYDLGRNPVGVLAILGDRIPRVGQRANPGLDDAIPLGLLCPAAGRDVTGKGRLR